MRKVVLYIALSIDGYIAKPHDDLSFLDIVSQEEEDYGYADFIQTVDTVIMGRKTYSWLMQQVGEFPHADKESYIITRNPQKIEGNTQFYTGSLKTLIQDLKVKAGKTIFIDGGAEIVNLLMKEALIDEFRLSLIPIFLGQGVRLFQEGIPETLLTLQTVKHFPTGLVQLQYTAR